MIRVAHLLINLNHGGAEHLVLGWTCARHAKENASTFILTLDEPGDLFGQVPDGIGLCLSADRSRRPWDFSAVTRLRRFLREHRIDVLQSHNLAAQQYGVLATVGSGVRHVQTQHGANTHLHGRLNRLRSRFLGFLTDRIVAVSAETRESMCRVQRLSRKKVEVIANGVPSYSPTDRTRVDHLRERYLPGGGFVFGSVGRLSEVKGWKRFLPHFAECVKQTDGAGRARPRLILVGDGPSRSDLEKQVEELGISGDVSFPGFQHDPAPWLELFDVFLLPSISEGLSVALLEAMEAGVYPLVTDVGDCGEVVRRLQFGGVLEERTAEWPRQLLALIENPPARQIGLISGSAEGSEFSEIRCLESYEDLYRRLTMSKRHKK